MMCALLKKRWYERYQPYSWLREHTLCQFGVHCAYSKRVRKFDSGKLPQLCYYCRLILDWGPPD
jgi:hypothetical protein